MRTENAVRGGGECTRHEQGVPAGRFDDRRAVARRVLILRGFVADDQAETAAGSRGQEEAIPANSNGLAQRVMC